MELLGPAFIWRTEFVVYRDFLKISIEVSFSNTSTNLLATINEEKSFDVTSCAAIEQSNQDPNLTSYAVIVQSNSVICSMQLYSDSTVKSRSKSNEL